MIRKRPVSSQDGISLQFVASLGCAPAGETPDNMLAAQLHQTAIEAKPILRTQLVQDIPIELRGLESRDGIGIGNFLALFRIIESGETGKFIAAAGGYGPGKILLEVAKKRNGVSAPNSSPMNSMGGEGASRRIATAARTARRSTSLTILSPKARLPI